MAVLVPDPGSVKPRNALVPDSGSIRPAAQSLKPDPGSVRAIVPDVGSIHGGGPVVKTPHEYDSYIRQAAAQTGVDPTLLRQVLMQESGLGASASYDAKTGRSRQRGNQGYGLGQLDPATFNGHPSPQQQAILNRAAKDPAFSIRYTAGMLKNALARAGGNPQKALSYYNHNPQYPGEVLARNLDPMQSPPASLVPDANSIRPRSEQAAGLATLPSNQAMINGHPITLTEEPSIDQEIEGKLPLTGIGGAVRHGMRMFDDAAQNPLAPFNAVLGAPQRANASLITQAKKNLRGVAEAAIPGNELLAMLDPAGRQALGNMGYAALHPNDPSIEANYEHTIGADKLKVAQPKNITDQLRNAGVDIGAQTISDPTVLGSGGIAKAAPLLEDAMRILGNRALTHDNPLVQSVARFLIPHPEERLAFTQKGVAAVRGIRQSETMKMTRQLREDQQLLDTHKMDLFEGKMPPEVENRLLKDAIIYGTDTLRKEAIDRMKKLGRPVPEEWTKNPPEGVINYHLKEEYFPHMGQKEQPVTFRGALTKRPKGTPLGTFQMKQESELLPQDPWKAIETRMASARAVIQHRMIQKRIAEETGMPFELFGKNGEDWEQFYSHPLIKDLTDKHILNSQKANEVLQHPQPEDIERVPGLGELSNIGRDTLIRSNPLPHAKNISTLAYLSGGIQGISKGIMYALTGPPKAIADRLEQAGGATHFMVTNPSKLALTSLPGLRTWGDVSARILDRVDQGMRAVRLEQIDKEFGNTLTDYEKAMKVNEDLGDYLNSPAYVNVAKAIGAQFPQWHGYIVPTAMARAIVRNTGRVMGLTRANQLLNQDVVQPDTGQNAYIGGPLTESSGALTPQGAAKYALSASQIGIVPPVAMQFAGKSQTYNPQDVDPELASQLIPGINVWGPMAGYNPFHSKAPPAMQAGLEAFGGYAKAPISPHEKLIRDIMERTGKTRIEAEQTHQMIMRYAR